MNRARAKCKKQLAVDLTTISNNGVLSRMVRGVFDAHDPRHDLQATQDLVQALPELSEKLSSLGGGCQGGNWVAGPTTAGSWETAHFHVTPPWVSQSTAAGPFGPPGCPWAPLDMFWHMYLGGFEHIESISLPQ
jgi:hypothetical protein